MTDASSNPRHAMDSPRCPRCGSADVYMPPLRTGPERWFTKDMLLLIFGISAPDPAYPHYRCRACREWWMQKGYAG